MFNDSDVKIKMDKVISNMESRFTTVRAGRANPNILNGVMVEYYGAPTPLNAVSTISVPEARQLMIKPFDKSLLKEIEKVTTKKQKYMEMFQNEVINIQELKKYTNPINEDIARLERELKLITSEIKEKDVLEKELNKTIKTVDDILNNQTITNAMLKTIIDVIEVDSDSNVEVRLKLLNEIGTNEPVITKFEDIYQNGEDTENKDTNNNEKNSIVLKSNISTQRRI